MGRRRTLLGFLVAGSCGAVVAACGGSTSDNGTFTATDGGAGTSGASGGGASGSSGGASTNAGGSSAGGADQNDASSAGGAAGAPASGGAGGVTLGDAGGCPAPTAGSTRICLTLTPEEIAARPEPELDKHGVLVVQIFDTPNPPAKDADKVALAERIFPPTAVLGGADGAVGPEIGLGELHEMRFDKAFPATVYVRAIFIDNHELLAKKTGDLGFGTWIGGLDLSNGIVDKEPLTAVPLQAGQGNAVNVTLTAFRRLRVTVHRSVTATGDGAGPLSVVAVNNQDPTKKPGVFGAASTKCADVSTNDVTVTGFVLGSGPLWVTGILNDLGQPGDFPPGGLASLDLGPPIRIPTQLTYAPTDYAVSTTIDLNYAIPWSADAGPVPPNSCAELAAPDGGP